MVRVERNASRWSVRTGVALLLLVFGYFVAPAATGFLYHLFGHPLHLRPSPPDTLGQATFGLSMVASLIWQAGLFVAVCSALGRSPTGYPIRDPHAARHGAIGLATGLLVMFGVILAIRSAGSAAIAYSGQAPGVAARNGLTWLVLDAIGAAGEEVFGRATLLLVAERLLGWRGAVVVSGAVFLVQHLGNPGASPAWLLRLFFQGMLLAYAVFRTGSLWWSVAYHTGWNWVSAPLFGAAGSGYLDEGHILDFVPHGSAWVTGGPVGPEGSLFAFLAVLAACGLLLLTTRRPSPMNAAGGEVGRLGLADRISGTGARST